MCDIKSLSLRQPNFDLVKHDRSPTPKVATSTSRRNVCRLSLEEPPKCCSWRSDTLYHWRPHMQCDVLEDSSKAYGTSNAKPITQIPAEWLVCFQLCLAEHTKFPVTKSLPLMCTPLKRPVERSKAPKPCTRPRSTPSTSTPPANPRTSKMGWQTCNVSKIGALTVQLSSMKCQKLFWQRTLKLSKVLKSYWWNSSLHHGCNAPKNLFCPDCRKHQPYYQGQKCRLPPRLLTARCQDL